MREWGLRLRLKRGMKIMQKDQSAKSCLLPYHCNSRFEKESIYIQLPLSLWRLILGGCGLIYEIKLVKIELRALMVPLNMIFFFPGSLLWCPWDCSSPLHQIPDPQRQELESSNPSPVFAAQQLLKRSFDNPSCLWHNIPHHWCFFQIFLYLTEQ